LLANLRVYNIFYREPNLIFRSEDMQEMIFRKMLLFGAVLCLAAVAFAQMNGARGTSEVTIKGKKISIDYGRPSLKGRDIFAMVQPGMVWRLGMNQATQIETTGDLVVAGKELKAGKYTLWAKKTGADSWTLAFHPKTGVWGAPPLTEGFVAEVPLKMDKVADSAEQLTITLAEEKGKAHINIHWGTAVLSGSFDVK
jgi:Protein of unknown function (DUF2911)